MVSPIAFYVNVIKVMQEQQFSSVAHSQKTGIKIISKKWQHQGTLYGMSTSPLFYATTFHLEHIILALNCLLPFGNKDDMLITIDENGFSFTRENNHVIKIQLFLPKEIFQVYHYESPEENGEMKVSLKIDQIYDSVNINRDREDSIECTLSYNGEGYPFVLIFEDKLITERVEYATFVTKDLDHSGFLLDRSQLQFECIIKGDILYNALQDLKEIGCKDCYLYGNISSASKKPFFALISRSQQGLSKIILPSERSILEKFQIYDNDSATDLYDEPLISVFDYSTLDKIRPSCMIANNILIRKDVHGLMTFDILNDGTEFTRLNEKERAAKRRRTDLSTSTVSDHPGIIVEISVMEKALPEILDVDEIKSIMIDTEERSISRALPKRKRINLDEEKEEYEPITADLPLFF